MIDLTETVGRHHSSPRARESARTMCRNGHLEDQATIMDPCVRNSRGTVAFFRYRMHVARYPCLLAYYPCTSLSKLTISMLIPKLQINHSPNITITHSTQDLIHRIYNNTVQIVRDNFFTTFITPKSQN